MQWSVCENFDCWKYMLNFIKGYLQEYVEKGYVLEEAYNKYFKKYKKAL